jgi:anti-sigma B factor antagonist
MASVNPEHLQNGRIVITDELTIYTVLALKETLLSALAVADELELDMSGIGEIDGAGLQLLVMVKQAATAAGKVLHLSGHSPVVLDLLDLSGLAGFFGDPLLIVRPSSSL